MNVVLMSNAHKEKTLEKQIDDVTNAKSWPENWATATRNSTTKWSNSEAKSIDLSTKWSNAVYIKAL